MKYCGSDCERAAICEKTLERRKDVSLPVVYERICPVCGAKFQTRYQKKIYCSYDCRYKGSLRMKRQQWAEEYILTNFS